MQFHLDFCLGSTFFKVINKFLNELALHILVAFHLEFTLLLKIEPKQKNLKKKKKNNSLRNAKP